jgi:pyrimidine-nucleoside phosphorylase
VTTRALITNMDQPLGGSVGNILEVREAINVLDPRTIKSQSGTYVRAADEVRDLALVHVASMLCMVHKAPSFAAAYAQAKSKLEDGSALDSFAHMVEAQGGDVGFLRAPDEHIAANTHSLVTMTSPANGKVRTIDAYKIGMASLALGSGRLHADDPIDPFAGLLLHAKVGDVVSKGDPLYTAIVGFAPQLASASARLDRGVRRAKDAFVIVSQDLHTNQDPLVSYVVDPSDIYSFDHHLDVKVFRNDVKSA